MEIFTCAPIMAMRPSPYNKCAGGNICLSFYSHEDGIKITNHGRPFPVIRDGNVYGEIKHSNKRLYEIKDEIFTGKSWPFLII